MNNGVDATKLIDGVIFLDRQIGSFTAATARVSVEDVSMADASSITLAATTIDNICHRLGEVLRINFQVFGPVFDEEAHYSVRVHIDLQGSGDVSPGDYMTTQNYPVLTFGFPDWVEVQVEKII